MEVLTKEVVASEEAEVVAGKKKEVVGGEKKEVRRTFTYRRCRFFNSDGEQFPQNSLADFISLAVKKEPNFFARREKSDIPEECRSINSLRSLSEGGDICAQLLDYKVGGNQPVVLHDENDTEVLIRSLSPKDKEQFLNGLLCFTVRSNHIVLMQAPALKSRHLENYLIWLLRDCTGVIPKDWNLTLVDQPSDRAKAEFKNVSQISLQPHIMDGITIARDGTAERLRKKALDAIMELMNVNNVKGAALSLNKAIKDDTLKLDIRFTIPRFGNRKSPSDTLDLLANVLRHSDDGDVKLFLHKTGTQTNEDLRLTDECTITVIDDVPILSQVGRLMSDWLTHLIASKRVDSKA